MNRSLIARAIDADILDRTLAISAECALLVDAQIQAGEDALWVAIK